MEKKTMKITITKKDNELSSHLQETSPRGICSICPTALAFARKKKINANRVTCGFNEVYLYSDPNTRWKLPKRLELQIRNFTVTRPRPLILGTFTLRRIK